MGRKKIHILGNILSLTCVHLGPSLESLKSCDSQSVVFGPAAAAASTNLLKMQILKPYP